MERVKQRSRQALAALLMAVAMAFALGFGATTAWAANGVTSTISYDRTEVAGGASVVLTLGGTDMADYNTGLIIVKKAGETDKSVTKETIESSETAAKVRITFPEVTVDTEYTVQVVSTNGVLSNNPQTITVKVKPKSVYMALEDGQAGKVPASGGLYSWVPGNNDYELYEYEFVANDFKLQTKLYGEDAWNDVSDGELAIENVEDPEYPYQRINATIPANSVTTEKLWRVVYAYTSPKDQYGDSTGSIEVEQDAAPSAAKPEIENISITGSNLRSADGGTYEWKFFGEDDSANWDDVTAADFKIQLKVGDGTWEDSTVAATLNKDVDGCDGAVTATVPANYETVAKQWRFTYEGGFTDENGCPPITQAAAEAPATPSITAIASDKTEFTSASDEVTITLTGTNLGGITANDIVVKYWGSQGWETSVYAHTVKSFECNGAGTSATAKLTFGTSNPKYQISVKSDYVGEGATVNPLEISYKTKVFTGITFSETQLSSAGGQVVATVTGSDLDLASSADFGLFVPDSEYPSVMTNANIPITYEVVGAGETATATFTLPKNETEDDVVYTFRVVKSTSPWTQYYDAVDLTGAQTQITVAAAEPPVTLTDDNIALDKTTYYYTGTAVEPVVTVTVGETVLSKDTHYTVSYADNTGAGTGTVTVAAVEGSGYTGTLTKQFTIEDATGPWDAADFTYADVALTQDDNVFPGNANALALLKTIHVVSGFSDCGQAKLAGGNTELSIPAADADGAKVQGVAKDAFKSKGLTSVQFPTVAKVSVGDDDPWKDYRYDGVTERGDFFILYGAFSRNSLASVDIPDGVLYIGTQAFAYNSQLKSVSLPQSLMTVQTQAFANGAVESVIFPDHTDYQLSLLNMSFAINKITEVRVPSNICQIGTAHTNAAAAYSTFYKNTGKESFPSDAPTSITKLEGAGVVYVYVDNQDAMGRLASVDGTPKTYFHKAILKDASAKPEFVIISRDDASYDSEDIENQPAAGGKYIWIAQDGNGVVGLFGAVDADDFKLQTKKQADTEWADASEGAIAVEDASEGQVRITATIPDNSDDFDKMWRLVYKHSDISTQYESCQAVQYVQIAVTAAKAAEVEAAIAGLPSEVTAENKAAVAEVLAAYEALTEAQKAAVSPQALRNLVKAQSAVVALEQEAVKAAQKEAADAKTELDTAKGEQTSAKTELTTVKTELTTSKSELQKAKEELEAAKKDLEAAKKDLEAAKKEVEQLKADLEQAKMKDQVITVKTESKTFKVKDLKKRAKSFKIGAKTNGKGKLTYKLAKKNGKITFKNGKVTVKKGTKAGTYKIKVKVTAAAKGNFKKTSKVFTIKVVVKKK